MKGHEAREDMKRKRKRSVRRGKNEKGNKWRGRKPMNPNLIKEPRQASLNMYVLCVRLSLRQVPMNLEQTSVAATTYGLPVGGHL